MRHIEIKEGNIFASKADVIVNPVNCVGVMGAGIALEYRLRYPGMFSKYRTLCKKGLLTPGKLWMHTDFDYRVLCFPTKDHWRDKSRKEFLISGLQNFVSSYKEKKIMSVAFPLLGAGRGGIRPQDSVSIMETYLREVDIPVTIYTQPLRESCDGCLFSEFREFVISLDSSKPFGGVSSETLTSIKKELQKKEVFQISHLLKIRGMNLNTLEPFCKEVDSYLRIHRW